MNLSRLEQRFGKAPSDLPPESEVDKMIATVTSDLDALHDAPLAEPYVGPAILEGRANSLNEVIEAASGTGDEFVEVSEAA